MRLRTASCLVSGFSAAGVTSGGSAHHVLNDGREGEDVAAGRDLGRDRRTQRDGAHRLLLEGLHVDLYRTRAYDLEYMLYIILN